MFRGDAPLWRLRPAQPLQIRALSADVAPFFHRLVGSVLHHLLKHDSLILSTLPQQQRLQPRDDRTIRCRGGRRLHLTGQSDCSFGSHPLKFGHRLDWFCHGVALLKMP